MNDWIGARASLFAEYYDLEQASPDLCQQCAIAREER